MVTDQIRALVAAQVPEGTNFTVERPAQSEHGDYATNAALVAAKAAKSNPRELAEQLQGVLQADALFDKIEVAGPGFLNFTVAQTAWQQVLEEVLAAGETFGAQPATGRRVQVEFISANPTGPLTLGNGRGGFGGDVLANVLERAGNAVEREYYLNDAGNQVLELGKSVTGEEPTYAGPYVEELKKQVTEKDPAKAGAAAAEILQRQISATVARMNINFDSWFSEHRQLHEAGQVEQVLQALSGSEATFEKDGALWLKSTTVGDDKDRVLRKSDGELTYLAADLAYHYDKLVRRKFEVAINIWGADHHGYLARLKGGVELLRQVEPFDGQLDIIITQLVRLVEDGKEVKMSKRAGTYVALDDLLDEIDVDVARFFFVMKSFDTHMDFDLGLAKEQSQKNPVYYLKYAHARICSILDQGVKVDASADLARLSEPAELALVRELAEWPEVIRRTAADYQVHRVPHYALQLADVFHKFYEQCRVISDDQELSAARLRLVEATRLTLRSIGDTLGIEMPATM